MIELKLLQNNNIVTIDIPGKAIIKSSGGLYHPNSMELLCVAFGSCIGKAIVKFCSQNKINVESFESIELTYDNKFTLYITHPKELIKKLKIDLEITIRNCPVGKLLKPEIDILFVKNKIEPDLKRKIKPCCGG